MRDSYALTVGVVSSLAARAAHAQTESSGASGEGMALLLIIGIGYFIYSRTRANEHIRCPRCKYRDKRSSFNGECPKCGTKEALFH